MGRPCIIRISQVSAPATSSGLASTGSESIGPGSVGIAVTVESYARFGDALAAGNFDGDGYDDLAVGIPQKTVDDANAAKYARFFDAEVVGTERCTDVIMRAHERRVADKLFNTANAVSNSAVSTEWSTAATCTPRADVMAGKQAMRAASGAARTPITGCWR